MLIVYYSILGIFTGDSADDDQQLFVVERTAFRSLCSALVEPCRCWRTAVWQLELFVQVHIIDLRVELFYNYSYDQLMSNRSVHY